MNTGYPPDNFGTIYKKLENQIKALQAKVKCLECCDTITVTEGAPVTDGTTVGELRIDPATNTLYFWDGDSWVVLAGGTLLRDHIGIKIDGGGAEIIAGFKDRFRIPYDATIVGWEIFETTEVPITGSIVIDVAKGTYADYDTTPTFVSISGTEKPTLTNSVKNQDLTLTTWTTAVSEGDLIEYIVDSASTVEIIQLYLILQRI